MSFIDFSIKTLGVMQRRTCWLRKSDNTVWCKREVERYKSKGFNAEVRANSNDMIAVYSDCEYISNTSKKENV